MDIKVNFRLKETSHTSLNGELAIDNGGWMSSTEGGPSWIHWVYMYRCWVQYFFPKGEFTDFTNKALAEFSQCIWGLEDSCYPSEIQKSNPLVHTVSHPLSCQSWVEQGMCPAGCLGIQGVVKGQACFTQGCRAQNWPIHGRGFKTRAYTHVPKFIC